MAEPITLAPFSWPMGSFNILGSFREYPKVISADPMNWHVSHVNDDEISVKSDTWHELTISKSNVIEDKSNQRDTMFTLSNKHEGVLIIGNHARIIYPRTPHAITDNHYYVAELKDPKAFSHMFIHSDISKSREKSVAIIKLAKQCAKEIEGDLLINTENSNYCFSGENLDKLYPDQVRGSNKKASTDPAKELVKDIEVKNSNN